MSAAVATEKQIAEVNSRLKRGEGWIGYRYSKSSEGDKIRSKYLYFAFYQGSAQKFVNSKTNDAEEAYRDLLKVRGLVKSGEKILPSDLSRLRYEHLIDILMDYYRDKKPHSIRTRRTEDGGKEETFDGKDKLDHFFKRMPVTDITAGKIQDFIKWRRKEGDAGATIRRQLGRLSSAFNRAKELDKLTDNHIPSFVLPEDSKLRKGFLDLADFQKLRNTLPEHLRMTVTFLYYTGCRTGAAKKITWEMVSKDCTEIELSAEIVKNEEALTLPLAGPLEEIATALREVRKTFPEASSPVLCFRNFWVLWNTTCDDLGLGKFDKRTRKYKGLSPHDFRRSAARNLIKAGVDRRTAMQITGHKTEAVFDRYNIKTTDDVKEALIKVGQFKPASVTLIAEQQSSR